MAKHIHIWLRGSTRDADGPAHAPAGSSKGGQFVSGSGGGGSAKKVVPGHSASANKSAKEQTKNLVNKATPAMQKEAAERKANGGGSKADVAGFMSRVAKKPESKPSAPAAKKTTYKGSKPDHIKSVSASNGKAVVHTNSGARHEISASSTGGKLPKVGEHIGQHTGAPQKTASPAPSSKADQAKPSAPAHHAKGSVVYTSHRNVASKATVLGPDPDSGNHLLVQVGNSKVSVPKSDVHADKAAANKYMGNE